MAAVIIFFLHLLFFISRYPPPLPIIFKASGAWFSIAFLAITLIICSISLLERILIGVYGRRIRCCLGTRLGVVFGLTSVAIGIF